MSRQELPDPEFGRTKLFLLTKRLKRCAILYVYIETINTLTYTTQYNCAIHKTTIGFIKLFFHSALRQCGLISCHIAEWYRDLQSSRIKASMHIFLQPHYCISWFFEWPPIPNVTLWKWCQATFGHPYAMIGPGWTKDVNLFKEKAR